MIIDQLHNTQATLYRGLLAGQASDPGLSQRLQAALNYLQTADLANAPTGTVPIDGTQVYAMIQEYKTRPASQGMWEAHRKYIDVQYVVKGVEHMGYANLAQLRVEPYDEARDFVPLHGEGSFVLLPAGMFIILTPEDAHMPGMTLGEPQPVKKVVVKVAVADR